MIGSSHQTHFNKAPNTLIMGHMNISTDIEQPAQPVRLEVGQPAPGFALPCDEGGDITLDELRGKKVVLYFYPAAMTPGCTTEACDFRDNIAGLSSFGYTVIGISKDPIGKLRAFRERDHISFPLLSDADLAAHKHYGAYGEKKLYGKTHVGVIRSTFVIDEDGIIMLAKYNVRAKGHVAALMKALGI